METELGPLIAVAGSTRPRNPDGTLRDDAEARALERNVRAACEELGQALAKRGCRILVYSADPAFIEADVVRGFCRNLTSKPVEAIHYRHPKSYGGRFKEQEHADSAGRFVEHLDDAGEGWEGSFYRSLAEADGVILVAGGNSTIITGHVALAFGKPVMPISCFDGAAAKLHAHVKHAPDAPNERELQAVLAWSPTSATRIVDFIVRRYEAQRARTVAIDAQAKEVDTQVKKLRAMTELARVERDAGLALIACAIVAMALGLIAKWSSASSIAVLPFIATLAAIGASGASVQLLRSPVPFKKLKTTALGAVAGILFGFLYLLPQLAGTANSTMVPTNAVQAALTAIVAFGAGMAAEAVLDAFRSRAVARADELATDGLGTRTGAQRS